MINNIRPFRFWCQKVLPLVYDDSLSYYEVLCKLKNTVNQLIQNNNNMEDFITERLDAMIEDYIKSGAIDEWIQELLDIYKEDIYYHCIDGTPNNGQCGALDVHGQVYLFDVGFTNPENIIAYLKNNNLTDIRGIIISHYDLDHWGNLEDILTDSDLDFTNCTVYLPHGEVNYNLMRGQHINYAGTAVVTFGEFQQERANIVRDIILSKELPIEYPTEGQNIILSGNCSVTFYNLKQSYFNSYYGEVMSAAGTVNVNITDPVTHEVITTQNTQYNNFSMISAVNFWGHRLVIPGDVQRLAQELNSHVWNHADIAVAPHHGLNKIQSRKYVETLSPDIFAIQEGQYGYDGFMLLKDDAGKMIDAGVSIFNTTSSGAAKITIPATVKAFVEYSGTPFSIIKNSNSLGFGEMLAKNNIVGNTDLNTLVLPGIYEARDSGIAATCAHNPFSPFGVGSGFKVTVEMISDYRRIQQTATASTSAGATLAIRRAKVVGGYPQKYANDATTAAHFAWTNWEYLIPSQYVFLDAAGMGQYLNSNLTATTNYNRVRAVNNIFMINLDVTASANISGNTILFEMPIDYQINQGYYTLQNITTGKPVRVSTSTNTAESKGRVTLSQGETINSGDIIRGTIVAVQNPVESGWVDD